MRALFLLTGCAFMFAAPVAFGEVIELSCTGGTRFTIDTESGTVSRPPIGNFKGNSRPAKIEAERITWAESVGTGRGSEFFHWIGRATGDYEVHQKIGPGELRKVESGKCERFLGNKF